MPNRPPTPPKPGIAAAADDAGTLERLKPPAAAEDAGAGVDAGAAEPNPNDAWLAGCSAPDCSCSFSQDCKRKVRIILSRCPNGI